MSGTQITSGDAGHGLERIAVLIPAWQPDSRLLELVWALRRFPFAALLVVDDGSDPRVQSVFEMLCRQGIPVIRHAVNLGKGRALKTGFNALLLDFPDIDGIVTADADGQHTAEDIVCVARALATVTDRPVLGSRALSGPVPLRSRLGNVLMRTFFRALTGTRLQDTQSGLRGLPIPLLPELMTLPGERYDYEMAMLAHLCRSNATPLEVPVGTLYLDRNRSSHFRPVTDSVRVCVALMRSPAVLRLRQP